ncbi:MAG: hypothetical protein AAF383_04155 [Cyanobacteria bacterium P01_A01_bin.83]
MSIFPKIKIKQLTMALFLAVFVLFTSSTNAIAASNKSETVYPTNDSQIEGLLYSNSNQAESLKNVDDFVSPEQQKRLLDPAQIPAEKQPIIDRSNPDNKLLEKTVQMFKDAGDFSAN